MMNLNSFEVTIKCGYCKSKNVDVKIIDTNSTAIAEVYCNNCKNKEKLKMETEIAMKQVYWDIIEQSKQGTNFDSEKQFHNLFELLKDRDEKFIRDFNDEWSGISHSYIVSDRDEYDKLHVSNGGIVDGNDTFYMDFGAWLVSQGEKLFKRYLKYGYQEVINYIKMNDIKEVDYTYECMDYVFQDLAKYKGHEYLTGV